MNMVLSRKMMVVAAASLALSFGSIALPNIASARGGGHGGGHGGGGHGGGHFGGGRGFGGRGFRGRGFGYGGGYGYGYRCGPIRRLEGLCRFGPYGY